MFFLKEKMSLGSFIRMLTNEVLRVPQYSYEDYLKIDSKSVLSQKEFEEFIDNLSFLRLLVIYAMLIDSKNRGQIKFSLDDFGKTYIQALLLSYQDNIVDHNEASKLSEVFSHELDSYSEYIETIPENDLLEKGFTPHACLYFTYKFTGPSKDSIKNGTYIALINNQRVLMKEYFEKALKKVRIIN